jgi:hypothetical protein
MRHIHNALIATAVVGLAALTASAADAQYAPRSYGYVNGPYDNAQSYTYVQPYDGRYYSYGADRANPSFSPRSYDQDNPRDQQLQGHN